MKIHSIQHVPFEGLGSIADWARSRSHALGATRLYLGEPLPAVEDIDLLIILGGPMNVDQHADHPWLAPEKHRIAQAIAAGKSVLGICLGAQLVARALGARVYANREKEIGWFAVDITPQAAGSGLFAGFPPRLDVFHWHGDTFDLPDGAVHVARSAACTQQAFVYDDRIVGLQFHLETTAASAREIIDHSAGDLACGRYVQTPQAMLADANRFSAINHRMHDLLDRLAAATQARMRPSPHAQR